MLSNKGTAKQYSSFPIHGFQGLVAVTITILASAATTRATNVLFDDVGYLALSLDDLCLVGVNKAAL